MAFVKDMLRMWAHSWKRFISIAMITLLGVAVLTGIYAGCRDAFRGTDRFFDAQGLHDIQVLSTAGLTDGDIAALRKVRGVAKVQAERSQEVTFDLGGRKSATMQEIGANGIDRPYVQEGRLPKKAGEIAVTRKFIRDSGKKIGSHLTVAPESSSSATSVSDSSESDTQGAEDKAPSFPTKLTIVGVVLDPQNLSNPDGYSAMTSFRSTAATDYTFFAPPDGVTGTLYTSATLLVKGSANENTFDESYENTVKQVTDRIDDAVKTDRQKVRWQELLDAGNRQIADTCAEADKKFAEAQSQIDENRRQFDQQVDQIMSMQAGATGAMDPTQLNETTRETMRETIIAATPELAHAKQRLDQAQSQLDEQKAQTEQTLKTKENELKTSIPQVRWYVQDRQSLGGFSALKSDLDSIQSLGNAFPIVFLVVAVMMSLTSMARMVEEDRSLIGTYVGLGYGRLAVASRYLLFALLACLIGGGAWPTCRIPWNSGVPSGCFGGHVCDAWRATGIRLAVRFAGHRTVRGRCARRHHLRVRAGDAHDARRADAAESAACRLTHSAGTNQAGLESYGVPQQSDRAQHFPLQVAPYHDGRRGGRLHRAHRLRPSHQ